MKNKIIIQNDHSWAYIVLCATSNTSFIHFLNDKRCNDVPIFASIYVPHEGFERVIN